MAGNSSITGDQSIMFTDNCSFDGTKRGGKLALDGQIWMGSTAGNADAPNFVSRPVRVGSLDSTDGSIDIVYSDVGDTEGVIDLSVNGGSTTVTSLKTDDGNVVPPTGGIINVGGGTTVAGITPVKTTGVIGTSTVTTTVQISQALAATDATKIGLSNYNNAFFSVDANGFVSGTTITPDSGGPISPSGGTFNLLGRSGSKINGSGSTLTVKSPPYSEQAASTTVTLNSGSFSSGVTTLTLPASAGLLDGDLFEFVCIDASQLTIQAVGSQKIRMGTLLSSAAGTAKSTSIGDAVCLRFRASDGFFYATSIVGTWLIA